MKKSGGSFPSQSQTSSTVPAKEHFVQGYKNRDQDGSLRSTSAEEKISNKATQKLESKPSMDINESAEAFIRNFRQQLLIQRLESIENYEKMLARGL